MATSEIERKFLVQNDVYRTLAVPRRIAQGYLNSDKLRTVRVRIDGDSAFLTVKSITIGISRHEFEYPIPTDHATELLALCEKPIIEKQRYRIPYRGMIWEIDEFLGQNEGLVVAEIELPDATTTFELPPWLGPEVSNDPRYFNSNLIRNPYSSWKSS